MTAVDDRMYSSYLDMKCLVLIFHIVKKFDYLKTDSVIYI